MFTRNRLAAPPVVVARERLRSGRIQAVLVNTKSANAGTGRPGRERAIACCREVAGLLGIPERLVVPCSTGKIGLPLSRSKIHRGIRSAVAELSPAGFWNAAQAIRTTDAFPKIASRRVRVRGGEVVVAGMAKGAGMIHPRMATTLAYVLTDASVTARRLRPMLAAAVDRSFHAISVDGDTSTNDTVLLLASGASGLAPGAGSTDERRLAAAVAEVLLELAQMIVVDGEGASKLVEVRVRGARTRADADRAARAIANSMLVKAAFHGADPNWGRVACAVGYSGADVDPDRIAVAIGGVVLARGGTAVAAAAERKARRAMLGSRFDVEVDLGRGRAAATMWTSDLGTRYVRFNSAYSS
jgi:glutamate N-acetyltransferase/amino-acid N-acetyltransferase